MSLAGWNPANKKRLTFDSTVVDADLTDFVANIKLSSSSGKTGFDMSDVFTELTPQNVDDDFTDVDGSAPNASKWSLLGDVDITSNALRVSANSTDASASASSNFLISGDFDVEVDLNASVAPDIDRWDMTLYMVGTYTYGVARYYGAAGGIFGQNTTDYLRYGDTATSSTAISMRITRVAGVIRFYWSDGSAWILLGEDTRTDTADMAVRFSVLTMIGTPSITALFDNFKVNSGTIVWPVAPKKIAFEVGYTGVQCYAEIVEWNDTTNTAHLEVKVPTITSAADAFLNFYFDSTHADNTTYIGDTNSAASDVANSDRVLMVHQAQDPSGTAPQMLDSSPQAAHGTSYGSMTSGDLIDGLTGKAIDYDGTDDYTNHGYNAAHDITDKLTIRAVIKPSMLLDSGATSNIYLLGRQSFPTVGEDTYAIIINVDGKLQLATSGGNIQTTKTSWASGTTFVVTCTYNSTGLIGDLFVDGVKEILSVDSLDTMSGSLNDLVISTYSEVAGFFPGMIDEVLIINDVMSDAWVKADNASLRDNLITYSLIPTGAVPVMSATAMPYGDLTLANLAATIMPFAILFPRFVASEMPYAIQLGMSCAMHYGDAPALLAATTMHYGDAAQLLAAVDMKFGDMLPLLKATEMPFHIRNEIFAVTEARYGINGEALMAVSEQLYSISEYNLLMKKVDMPYLLQSAAMIQHVNTSLDINGVDILFNHVSLECSLDNFVIAAELHIVERNQFVGISMGDAATLVCNSDTYNFIVSEEPKITQTKAGSTVYVLQLKSPADKLTSSWSRPLQQEFSEGLAEDIINNLLSGVSLPDCTYNTVTFPVKPATLYANNEDRRTIIKKLNASVGAKIQSDPDGGIRIEPEYVKGWNTDAPVEYYMSGEANFISQDETPDRRSGKNMFLVGNTMASDERTWPEQRDISDGEKEVMGFQVPWGYREITGLTHSGGDWVNPPEYMDVVEEIHPPLEEPAEQVEFKAGFSTATKPIYGDLQVEWLRQNLGAITYGEDGKLEAELKTGVTEGYSLAAIRYPTRYHLWKVRDAVPEDVQYLLWVEK